MFIIPGLFVIMIASLTLIAQTLKATMKNPVKEIRNNWDSIATMDIIIYEILCGVNSKAFSWTKLFYCYSI
jgi:NhaP-type Na+/H+ or K+/H+ antiporter